MRKIDKTLLELMIGILAWGVFWQIAGVWFVEDKLLSSIGLWIGVILALLAAVHMYWALNKALSLDEKGAQKVVMSHSLIRYGVIVLVLAVLGVTQLINPLITFLGVMGLKAAAYMQPFIHRFISKDTK